MLTDAGKTLGFRGGKAQRSWELIQALNARESTLNALYDFRPLISPEGWLPPVVTDIVGAGQQHGQTVKTECQTCVRRSTVFQSVEQEAEFLALFTDQPHSNRGIMDSASCRSRCSRRAAFFTGQTKAI